LIGEGFFMRERTKKSKIMTRIKIMIKSKIMRDACEDAARAGRWIAACHTNSLGFEVHARVLRTNCGGIMRRHF
jgi:hypothetical protein